MSSGAAPLRVRLQPSGVELPVAPGERVLDALDDWPETGLPFACRAGNCGACLTLVRSGGALLAPAGRAERETLAELGPVQPELRLGCQLRAAPGVSGLIVLEVRSH